MGYCQSNQALKKLELEMVQQRARQREGHLLVLVAKQSIMMEHHNHTVPGISRIVNYTYMEEFAGKSPGARAHLVEWDS